MVWTFSGFDFWGTTTTAANPNKRALAAASLLVLALLVLPLIAWMIDVHLAQGYTEIYPPFMVREACMTGTGNLPKFGDVLYRDAE